MRVAAARLSSDRYRSNTPGDVSIKAWSAQVDSLVGNDR